MKIEEMFNEADKPAGLSRRGFLKGVGATAATAAVPGLGPMAKTAAKTATVIPGLAASASAPSGISMLMKAMMPLLDTVNSELETDDAGEEWRPGMDFSSYDHRDQMGTFPNGDPFESGKTASGVDYLYTYDLNDSGGDQHVVYMDPKTKKPVFLRDEYRLHPGEDDFEIELEFDTDPDKLPAGLRYSANPNVVSIDDMSAVIDDIIKAGGPQAYLKKLQSIAGVPGRPAGLHGDEDDQDAEDDDQGDPELDAIVKNAGVQTAKSAGGRLATSAAGAIRGLLGKIGKSEVPQAPEKHMGPVTNAEPLALPAPSSTEYSPFIKDKKQYAVPDDDTETPAQVKRRPR